eukprot:scaffold4734_cov176-Ochromonas_danica.AAC.7
MDRLSDDLLIHIASYFPGRELYLSGLVNREWREVVYSSFSLWTELARNYGVDKYAHLFLSARQYKQLSQSSSSSSWSNLLYKFACSECRSLGEGLVVVDINQEAAHGRTFSPLLPFCVTCSDSVSRVPTLRERMKQCLPRCRRKWPNHIFVLVLDKLPYPRDKKTKRRQRQRKNTMQ